MLPRDCIICRCDQRVSCIHEHPQVILAHRGRVIGIDKGILPLIERLWQDDIKTLSSCQGFEGSSGYVTVAPSSVIAARNILSMSMPYVQEPAVALPGTTLDGSVTFRIPRVGLKAWIDLRKLTL